MQYQNKNAVSNMQNSFKCQEHLELVAFCPLLEFAPWSLNLNVWQILVRHNVTSWLFEMLKLLLWSKQYSSVNVRGCLCYLLGAASQ